MISKAGRSRRALPHVNNCGFTLIELLLVLVLMSVLMVGTVPLFRGVYEGMKTENAARELSALIGLAQNSAVTEGVAYRVNISTQERRVWLSAERAPDTAPDVFERVPVEDRQYISLPAHVTITKDESAQSPIIIECRPDARVTPLTLRLVSKDGYQYTLEVTDVTGQIRLRKPGEEPVS